MPTDTIGSTRPRGASEAPWAVVTGDIVMLHTPDGCDPRVIDLLSSAEVAFGNLEVPLTQGGVPAEKAVTHRAPPERAAGLRALGLTAVTLANNHALDYGVVGMQDTMSTLDGVGITHVGAGANTAEALTASISTTEHGTVALLGLSASLPPGFAASDRRPGIAPLHVLQQVSVDPHLAAEQPGMAPYVMTSPHAPDLDAACSAVTRAREEADLVVVALHWGVPHGFAALSYGPLADYQPAMGRALVDAGADLVIGHHPHLVHPVEVYNGGLIAYSVGNLMFHNWAELTAADETSATERTAPAGLFPCETPSAPYHSPFAAPEALDSVLVLVRAPRPEGPLTIRFVPTTMVDGDPVVPDVDRCRAILARLQPLDRHSPEVRILTGDESPVRDAIIGEVALDGTH